MSMTTDYPRDLIGYGRDLPEVRWPGQARVAVQFVLNYEEGGENCVLHGDSHSERFLSEIVGAEPFEDRHMTSSATPTALMASSKWLSMDTGPLSGWVAVILVPGAATFSAALPMVSVMPRVVLGLMIRICTVSPVRFFGEQNNK